MATCYLRKTEVELADGKLYSFRALPFNRNTAGIVGRFLQAKDGEVAPAMFTELIEVIEQSLSWDNDADEVQRIFDAGLIPFPTDEAGVAILGRIMGALINQSDGK